MTWHGYLLVKLGAAPDAGRRETFNDALLAEGRQTDEFAHNITHSRESLNGQQTIVELVQRDPPTRQQFDDAIGEIADTFTVFAGRDWEERRQNTVQFLIDNAIDWEEVEVVEAQALGAIERGLGPTLLAGDEPLTALYWKGIKIMEPRTRRILKKLLRRSNAD